MAEQTIHVTPHALARWRERGAAYADVPARDAAAAVLASRPVADDEPLPPLMARAPGFEFFRHEPTGVYFVAKRVNPARLVVVSAVLPGFRNYLRPKSKKKVPAALANGPPPDPVPRPRREPDPAVHGFEPSHADAEAEFDWLTGRVKELVAVLARMTKRSPGRSEAKREWERACERRRALKLVVHELRRGRRNSEGIYRPDGGINYEPAIRHLLAAVEKLRAEVAELRGGA